MEDSFKIFPGFKKFDFNTNSDQWVLYDETFQVLFTWLSNIKDENILSDTELIEGDELKRKMQFLESSNLQQRLENLNINFNNILNYTDKDVQNLELENSRLEETNNSYSELIAQIQIAKTKHIPEVSELEHSINEIENDLDKFKTMSLEEAKKLQDLQRANKKSYVELNDCFSKLKVKKPGIRLDIASNSKSCKYEDLLHLFLSEKPHYSDYIWAIIEAQSPPLFIYQMPLEQYYHECDSFMQYLNLYIKENFRIQDYVEVDNNSDVASKATREIDTIIKKLFIYAKKDILAKAQTSGVNRMTDDIDMSRLRLSSVNLKKETQELRMVNTHYFEMTYELLITELKGYLQQFVQQRIEKILYENTKLKLERATKRLENIKIFSKTVTDALSNAEILWVLMQFDLEKAKDKFDNSNKLCQDTQTCIKRMEVLRCIQSLTNNSMSELLAAKISEILIKYEISNNHSSSIKTCLFEYEKFNRLTNYAFHGITSNRRYTHVLDVIKRLNNTENLLSKYVYDGPVKRPMLENINYLEPICKRKITLQHIEKSLRSIRSEFHEQISEKMSSDRFWRYGQVLWMWFLTEPKKITSAIEEIRKEASKVPAESIKALDGIKRR